MFQHTAARRRLENQTLSTTVGRAFQHTAARRRLGGHFPNRNKPRQVSTHSRPKAAGSSFRLCCSFFTCFNTQPPEGGWPDLSGFLRRSFCFNTQPPEGGWYRHSDGTYCRRQFQHTAARRRLGRLTARLVQRGYRFNTQPPEGGWLDGQYRAFLFNDVSTHSRPKAAGFENIKGRRHGCVSTHSRPKAAGLCVISDNSSHEVSTHSRPKAAGING